MKRKLVNLVDAPVRRAITITLGDRSENHPGMQINGTDAKRALSLSDLKMAQDLFQEKKCKCELIDLVRAGNVKEDEYNREAAVLVIRQGLSALVDVTKLASELSAIPPDKKAKMRGKVKNKLARHNFCIGPEAQEPNYNDNKGRIVPYSQVPLTEVLRQKFIDLFKLDDLVGEANCYYDLSKTGIGFHGDAERKIVIAFRIGDSFPLHFQWYHHGERIGKRIPILLNGGDIYIMSEKAVGRDWRRTTIPTLRHAAGCAKYLNA